MDRSLPKKAFLWAKALVPLRAAAACPRRTPSRRRRPGFMEARWALCDACGGVWWRQCVRRIISSTTGLRLVVTFLQLAFGCVVGLRSAVRSQEPCGGGAHSGPSCLGCSVDIVHAALGVSFLPPDGTAPFESG